MDRFLNLKPTSWHEAVPVVVDLTSQCWRIARRIQATDSPRRARVLIAQFHELNEARVRIVDQFGLEKFVANLTD